MEPVWTRGFRIRLLVRKHGFFFSWVNGGIAHIFKNRSDTFCGVRGGQKLKRLQMLMPDRIRVKMLRPCRRCAKAFLAKMNENNTSGQTARRPDGTSKVPSLRR